MSAARPIAFTQSDTKPKRASKHMIAFLSSMSCNESYLLCEAIENCLPNVSVNGYIVEEELNIASSENPSLLIVSQEIDWPEEKVVQVWGNIRQAFARKGWIKTIWLCSDPVVGLAFLQSLKSVTMITDHCDNQFTTLLDAIRQHLAD